MKNTLDWINSWLDILEKKINELEDIAKETIQNEVQKEKQIFLKKMNQHQWTVTNSSGLLHV